uniref:Cytochrome c oxidase subunit 3 n=1 Tax=Septifer bilocularis TaxID=102393 RepID=A0A516EZL2_9BIVA|nr:cytochrome c oxidase subunit III [Septifer bilocularis]QDO71944.1 cytochrome c oxidase subunit III [Septifer bilocularis]
MKRSPLLRFYVPDPSPWPFFVAIALNNMAIGLVLWMHRKDGSVLMLLGGALILLISSVSWWRDLLREGDMGFHTRFVIKGYRDGMGLFIFSEVMFFFSFFWAFFHNALSPSTELGMRWPPPGIRAPQPCSIPLFNTALLISSGAFVTLAHKSVISTEYVQGPLLGLFMAIVCGVLFLFVQGFEYFSNSFTLSDSVYGSVFYVLTGFHGTHVLVGSVWLIVTFVRTWLGHFRQSRHFGMSACIWYWHFVDVVWLFVYFMVYSWFGGHLYKWWFNYWNGNIYSFSYKDARPSWYIYIDDSHKPDWYNVPKNLEVKSVMDKIDPSNLTKPLWPK